MRKPKVFLCWTLNSGTTFYRMMNPARYMRKETSLAFSKWKPDFQGVAEWEFKIPGDKNVANDLHTLITECDITIAQKFHSIGGLALMDAFRHQFPKKPFYSEFDDHIFAVNPDSPASEQYSAGSEMESIALEQIKLSTGIITSTNYLRGVFEKLNPNVWVIPNGIDFNLWDSLVVPVKKTKKIRIGWAGGGSHINDLEFIEPVVTSLSKKYSNIEFVFLGGVPPCFKDRSKIQAYSKWYPINEYPQALRNLDLDIALAPLRDNEFNRGKSNLRWLEYSAMKVPTVASNVEPFKCIKDGEDGLLVTEKSEWETAISSLIEDEALRKKIGLNAYKRVKKDFNVEKIGAQYSENIRLMIAGKAYISPRAVIDIMSGH